MLEEQEGKNIIVKLSVYVTKKEMVSLISRESKKREMGEAE